uniref:Uncharacterized protein n=1 Tax=Panstrongylus lignarius TaxID=156445 RepID=A0A224XSK9_9HEMI
MKRPYSSVIHKYWPYVLFGWTLYVGYFYAFCFHHYVDGYHFFVIVALFVWMLVNDDGFFCIYVQRWFHVHVNEISLPARYF